MDDSALHFCSKSMQLDGHFGTFQFSRIMYNVQQWDGAPVMFTIRHHKKIPHTVCYFLLSPTFSRKHAASTCQRSRRPWWRAKTGYFMRGNIAYLCRSHMNSYESASVRPSVTPWYWVETNGFHRRLAQVFCFLKISFSHGKSHG